MRRAAQTRRKPRFSAKAGPWGRYQRGDDEAVLGNRPFTMTPDWGFKAQGKERKGPLAPPAGRPLSVRLSGL
jgi:hypothetical protein